MHRSISLALYFLKTPGARHINLHIRKDSLLLHRTLELTHSPFHSLVVVFAP